MNRDFKQVIPGMILVIVLIGIIFASNVTSERVTEAQAVEYLDLSSHRTAEELEKTFSRQSENILTMAHMTAHIMDYERIDTEKLVHLTESSSFDGIEYIHPTGSSYGMNESSWDVRDKEYFRDAVQQRVGYAYDYAPERGKAGCMVFYSPIVSDQGDFYGILVGYLREETLENMLDISFWGHSISQHLCTPDGTIIASNTEEESNVNILDTYEKNGDITAGEREQIAGLLKEGDGAFQFEKRNRHEVGSVSDVADGKLLLVETFPPEILSELSAPVLNKMHLAVVAVVVSIAAYGVIMFIISRKHRNDLEKENAKVTEQLKGAENLANRDQLTGLYNRRGMQEMINARNIERRQRAFVLVDVDNFKQLNDNLGHKAGDELLMYVSRLLQEVFRKEDILVRMGGDEFAVILPNFKQNQADVIKKKLTELNERLQHPADNMPVTSVSAGVAFSRIDENDELFVRADKALYKMKEKGRCGYCIYEEEFEA